MNQEISNAPTTPAAGRPLDVRTFWIGVLAVIFAVLLAAHALQPGAFLSTATAAEAVDSRDYMAATALQDDGSEALYVLDKRTGLLALLVWDPQTRRPQPVAIQPVQAAFGR